MRWMWLGAALWGVGCKDSDADGTRDNKDCAPEDFQINPEAPEVCDGIDNNCNGQIDEDVSITAYWDRDLDGYGDPGFARRVCELPDDGSLEAGDCNDFDPLAFPGAVEICNLADDDCDGQTDEDVLVTFYRDDDGDGHGVPGDTTEGCYAPQGFSPTDDDCDDTQPFAWTDAEEVCDGIDNDCDGSFDEDLEPTRQWEDADGDGYGNPDAPVLACGPGTGIADNDLDCDDTDAATSPDTIEARGNQTDDDCDGYVDEFGVGPGNEFATVAEAMASAPNGSVIQLDQGFHLTTVDLTAKTLTFAGEGCGRTTLYADAQGTGVTTDDDLVERLTISGGTGTILDPEVGEQFGGGVLVQGDATLRDMCVEANSADHGGGVAVVSGTLTAENVEVTLNTSSLEGAGVYVGVGATANVWASQVAGNVSSAVGGGVVTFGGTLNVTNTVVAGNQCSLRGCGVYGNSHVVEIDEDTEESTPSAVTLDQVTLHANTSDPGRTGLKNGEAVYQEEGTISLSHVLFTGHQEPYVVFETSEDPVVTTAYVGYRGNAGPDVDYESFQQDRIAQNVSYILDDPALTPPQWDLRLREGSGFRDVGDPARSDPDGSIADLGAFGGPLAPEGWDFGWTSDEDGDGMLDGYEIHFGTNRYVDDSTDDDDGDGLTHLEEHALDADPLLADTDGDGVSDGIEVGVLTSPLAPWDQAPHVVGRALLYTLVGEPVVLSVEDSFDPNLDPLTFTWTVSEAPPTASSVPADPNSAATTFEPDVSGTFVLQGAVSDGSTSRSLLVTVVAVTGAVVPDDYDSVQEAIDDGEYEIGVRPGTYVAPIRNNDQDLTLIGLGSASEVVLDGGGYGSTIVADDASLVLAHLTVTGGYAYYGGGIHAQDTVLTLTDVTVADNHAVSGGGLWIDGDEVSAVMTEVRLVDNFAQDQGGGMYLSGEDIQETLVVHGGWFAGNHAAEEGGALFLDGGIYEDDADFYLYNTVFLDNEATVGAAWWHSGLGSDINLWNSTLVGNRGESLAYSDQGRNIVISDVLQGNEVTMLWDGDGVVWQHFDGVWADPTDPAFYDPESLVSQLTTHLLADPLLGSVTNDGDPMDDLVGPRSGSPVHDAGFLDHLDPDTSRADVGACGGPGAAGSCARYSFDADNDGLSDGWELAVGLDPTLDDSGDDHDGDGLDALAEQQSGTRPDRADTDSDGVDDATELASSDDPLDDRAHRPVAVLAGEAETIPVRVEVGESIVLDASPSYDPDGGTSFTYQWRIVGRAPGSTLTDADLENADQAQVTFSPDRSGAFRLGLVVHDGTAGSRERIVWVVVPKELGVPGEYPTVDDAVAAASPGDIVRLGPGSWELAFNPGDLPLVIAGAGVGETIVEPVGAEPIFRVDADGELGLRDMTIRNGVSYLGGAVRCEGGQLEIERVRVERSVAYNGGGLYAYNCTSTLVDVDFDHNHSAWSGGGVYVLLGSFDWVGGSASFNTSGYTGGGLVLLSSDATLRNLHLHRNQAENVGGAMLVEYSGASSVGFLDARYLTITGNRGQLGAIYRVDGIPFTLTHSSIVDNTLYGFYDAYTAHTGLTLNHNNWFINTVNSNPLTQSLGATDIRANPKFVAYDVLGVLPDDVHIQDDSPQRDAGETAEDPDGSLADLGAYGGPEAPADWDIYFRDTDGDGMADGWEDTVGLDPAVADAGADPDSDTLTNLVEFGYHSDPFVVDTDADGVSDEVEAGDTDPTNPTDYAPSASGGVDQTVIVGSPATFVGTGTDPQADPVFYEWTLYQKPGGSALTTASLSGANTNTVTLTPDHPGQYILQLVTNDGSGYSKPDLVIVRVPGDLDVPGDYPTVAQAVKAAENGATLFIEAGTFPAILDLDGKDLSFVGAGRDQTILDGGGEGAVIKAIDGEIVSLEGLTVANGRGGRGGGAWLDDGSVLSATDVAIASNTAGEGGGLFLENSSFSGTDVRLVDNEAGYRGGGLNAISSSTFDLSRTLVAGNRAINGQGGGLRFVTGDLIGDNVIFSDNESYEGGGIYLTSSALATLDHVTATYNYADYQGSFVRIGDGCDLTLSDSIVTANDDSAAISEHSSGGEIVLSYSLVTANELDFSLDDETLPPVDGVDGNDLDGTPDLLGLTDDGDWTNDDWTLGPASSAIDAGDPLGTLDPDSSAPDMGAFGGEEGDWQP
jgi:hypothetical protein